MLTLYICPSHSLVSELLSVIVQGPGQLCIYPPGTESYPQIGAQDIIVEFMSASTVPANIFTSLFGGPQNGN